VRLAFRNILHDRLRFLLTIAGIAISAFLMMFQGSLLAGFGRAASRVIDSIDADLWVMPRGVQSFDFVPSLHPGYAGIVQGVPGVSSVKEIATGFTFWQRPNGTRKTIVAIGTPPGLTGSLPASGDQLLPEQVLVDQGDMETLGVGQLPADVEINQHRRRVTRSVAGFGTFLGSPYVFGRLADTRRCLGLGEDEAMFLVLKVAGRDVEATQAALRARVPELDVLRKDEFSARARRYWTMQTGAGAALLAAAVLGFVVGVLIVSQTVYATTMEHLEEFATLKALGASSLYIVRIVTAQALAGAILGSAAGMLLTIPAASAARRIVSWIYTPWQLPVILGAATIVLAALSSVTAARAALMVEPGRVFRA